MSRNPFSTVPETLFHGLNNLRYIDFHGGYVTELPPKLIRGTAPLLVRACVKSSSWGKPSNLLVISVHGGHPHYLGAMVRGRVGLHPDCAATLNGAFFFGALHCSRTAARMQAFQSWRHS